MKPIDLARTLAATAIVFAAQWVGIDTGSAAAQEAERDVGVVDVYMTISPREFQTLLAAEGVEMQWAGEGPAARLDGSHEGLGYSVFFFDCAEDRADLDAPCRGLELFTSIVDESLDLAWVNDWNLTYRMGRMALSQPGEAALNLSVVVDRGVTGQNLLAHFGWWRLLLDTLR
jgi:hypothetical protein